MSEPHPGPSHRLLVGRDRWKRLRDLPAIPILHRAAELLATTTEPWVIDRTITVHETTFNWHLIRARQAQTRIVSLLVQYGRTGDRRFRDAALEYVRDMGRWEYCSWSMWRAGNPDPNATFELTYGENAMTLALVYDWLAGELTGAERALILDIATRCVLQPYLANVSTPGKEAGFFRTPNNNWNAVCNGGAGLLALALGAAHPDSARVLQLVGEGLPYYFKCMANDGAWPEGIGYWQYGHRYGYWYLLAHERATGRPHPLLELPAARNTLRFPLLFSPGGVPASFGDVNSFFPIPFHYAAAQRYGMNDVIAELDRRYTEASERDPHLVTMAGPWPDLAELLLLHPGQAPTPTPCDWPRVSVQKGLEWCYLADQWTLPKLYASVRGGTTYAPHVHQDLLSFIVIVDGEPLLPNIGADDYIDTTFSKRRFELYEMNAASKNTLLVNGIGVPHPAAVKTTHVTGENWDGVLLDATAALDAGSPAKLCQRAVLMLNKTALLVIDHVVMQYAALVESRYHTYARVRRYKAGAMLHGAKATLGMSFASSVPAAVKLGTGLPTHPPREPDTVVRWLTQAKQFETTLMALLTPNAMGRVKLDSRRQEIHATGPGFDVRVKLDVMKTPSAKV